MDAAPSSAALVVLLAATVSILLFLISRDAPANRNGDERIPPVLPLDLPIVGHLIQFLWDTEKLLAKASEPWLVQILINAFGLSKSDVPFYLADNTGFGRKPLAQSNPIPPEHRIFYLAHQSIRDGLSGKGLEELQSQIIRNFYNQIERVEINEHGAWTDVPDLYGSLLRTMCFTASVTSFCGSRILEALPNLESDFWDYDSHLPRLFREVPQWLSPASYASRNRMKENIKRWHGLAQKAYDMNNIETDTRSWEEFFGSHLFRSRQVFFSKTPLSQDSLAAEDLGLLWAATANVIPAIGWMVLEAVQRPTLLERVRAEIAPFVVFRSDGGPPEIDLEGLCQQPLVQSMYAEVLRVHNGTVIVRVPQESDFTISGWLFPKEEPILVSTTDAARVPSIWNHVTPDKPRSIDEFWPERFIVDPIDPTSGPVLPQVQTQYSQGDQPVKREEPSQPYFSLNGTAGAWVPFGGGSHMCPGRHFAKREMIVAMAMFITAFDVELAPRDGWIQQDKSTFMLGVMHPKGPIPARVRRRKLTAG